MVGCVSSWDAPDARGCNAVDSRKGNQGRGSGREGVGPRAQQGGGQVLDLGRSADVGRVLSGDGGNDIRAEARSDEERLGAGRA